MTIYAYIPVAVPFDLCCSNSLQLRSSFMKGLMMPRGWVVPVFLLSWVLMLQVM